MRTTQSDVQRVLANVASGKWDALTPADVELLEHGTGAAAAQRLGNQRPVLEADFIAPTPEPTAAEWAQVWRGVEAAHDTRGRFSPAARRHGWRGVAALAACVALAIVWRGNMPAEPELRLARDLRIEELTFAADATGLVWTTDGPGGLSIIWVVEHQEGATS